MIETFFLICAVVGGTILILQATLALLGLGGDLAHGGDLPDMSGHALPDLGGHDLPGVGGHDVSFHHGDDGQGQTGKVLSIQAVVAFLTFLGIGGLSALEAGWSQGVATAVAFVCGLTMMLVLGWFLGQLRRLQSDGTLRLEEAAGSTGRVYLSVPAHDGGAGKVTLTLQGRVIEIEARTPGPELRCGDPIVVTRVLDGRTVEVADPASHLVKPVSLHD